jgi:very-short-patch-repair endonuclease
VTLGLVRRRALRRNSTEAEALLWSCLRAKRFAGFKFRRQHPCGPYILDFYCPSQRLAIELDGGQHFEAARQTYDDRRTAHLQRRGIGLLRFTNDVLFTEREGVLDAIALALGDPSPERPERWVTDQTGDMGDSARAAGRCLDATQGGSPSSVVEDG